LVNEGLAANQLVEVLDAYAPPAQPIYAVHVARAFLEIAKRHLVRLGAPAAATRN
jgi:hypothetical protein